MWDDFHRAVAVVDLPYMGTGLGSAVRGTVNSQSAATNCRKRKQTCVSHDVSRLWQGSQRVGLVTHTHTHTHILNPVK